MKKISVAKDLCIGCGACAAIAPENFNFDDDGKSNVISNENIESQSVVNAIESCPTSAISIIDSSTKEEEKNNNQDCECDNNCHCQNHCDCHNN